LSSKKAMSQAARNSSISTHSQRSSLIDQQNSGTNNSSASFSTNSPNNRRRRGAQRPGSEQHQHQQQQQQHYEIQRIHAQIINQRSLDASNILSQQLMNLQEHIQQQLIPQSQPNANSGAPSSPWTTRNSRITSASTAAVNYPRLLSMPGGTPLYRAQQSLAHPTSPQRFSVNSSGVVTRIDSLGGPSQSNTTSTSMSMNPPLPPPPSAGASIHPQFRSKTVCELHCVHCLETVCKRVSHLEFKFF
jgi:hypothetical protein